MAFVLRAAMRSVACAPLIASAVAPRLAPSMSLRIATAAAPSATQLSGLVPVRSYRSGVTKSSVKKRFRLKASGLIVRHKANKRHINRHKSSARLNRLTGWAPLANTGYRKKYKEMLMIGRGVKR